MILNQIERKDSSRSISLLCYLKGDYREDNKV